MWLLCIFAFLFVGIHADPYDFDGHVLVKVNFFPSQKVEVLKLLQENTNGRLLFWLNPTIAKDSLLFSVAPEETEELFISLRDHYYRFEIIIENLKTVLQKSKISKYQTGYPESLQFEGYYDLESINQWLNDAASKNKGTVKTIVAGKSYEGNLIKGIKISNGPSKKTIFLEGGLNSREWISISTTLYIAKALLYNKNNTDLQNLAKKYNWYIFPVANPDGYKFTMEKFRLWRKNRQAFEGYRKPGQDLANDWIDLSNGESNVDSLQNEVSYLSNQIRSIKHELFLYLAFRGFGQALLIPTSIQLSSTQRSREGKGSLRNNVKKNNTYTDDLYIAQQAIKALTNTFGTKYKIFNSTDNIYALPGGSVDWVKTHLQKRAFAYHLQDDGQYGYLLPSSRIKRNNEEVLNSVIALVKASEERNGAIILKCSILALLSLFCFVF